MKRLFLLTIIIGSLGIQMLKAQCTPTPFSGSSLISPDTSIGIAQAVETQAYQQIIRVRIPADTNYNGAVIPIDSAGIDSITGVPSSFSWVSNSANNYWPGDTFGCVLVQGTPLVGDAGVYSLSIHISVNALGTSMPYSFQYDFVVLDASHVGIDLAKSNEFQLFQNFPNPFIRSTQIRYYAPKASVFYFSVFDIVGNVIEDKRIESKKGNNSIQFAKGNLPAGIYIYELASENKVIRKRMLIK